jgi:hypothetical protein
VTAGGGVIAVVVALLGSAQKPAFASVTVVVTVGPGMIRVNTAVDDNDGPQRRVVADERSQFRKFQGDRWHRQGRLT